MLFRKKLPVLLMTLILSVVMAFTPTGYYSHASSVESSSDPAPPSGGESSEPSGGGDSGSPSGDTSPGDTPSGDTPSGDTPSGGGSSDDSSSQGSGSSDNESSSDSSGSGEPSPEKEKEDKQNESSRETGSGDSARSERGDGSSRETSAEDFREEAEIFRILVEEKNRKKEVVKDDSKGRDYSDLEIVSSGNTSFTIVSVSRNEEEVNKKLKKLKKRRKKLRAKKSRINERLARDKAQAKEIKAIYGMLDQVVPDKASGEILLTGCIREGAYLPNPDCLGGLDERLSDLAETYDIVSLTEWTDRYTTEYLPQSVKISEMENDEQVSEVHDSLYEDKGFYSSADPILKSRAKYCEVSIAADRSLLKDVKKKLKDVKEHIRNLEELKEANTIYLDSRLVEYKDVIPDETVEFLNAVVAKEGTPYVWGASGPGSFDCSGLVSYGLRECKAAGAGFRWTSYDFVTQLREIPFEEARPGDLVWKHGHIAIYIDEGTVFEAPYTGARVRFTACDVSSRFSRALRWWSKED